MANAARSVNRVCVVSGARSEYGLLKPIMNEIQNVGLDLNLIVAGMHLCHEFGNTYRAIEADGFQINAKIDMTFGGDNNASMAKSIGIGIYGISQALEQIDPDAVLVLGDRVEAFAGGVSGAALNKLVAHIHGGEATRGGLDESMRHAITKFAHVHFAATETSKKRIIRLGERPEMVFMVGAPGIDSILDAEMYEREKLGRRIGITLTSPFILIVQHSVSSDPDAGSTQMRQTLEALDSLKHSTLLVYPNSDAGGRRMIEIIESYRDRPWLHIVKSLDRMEFLSLLNVADVLVGNSSSGIIESPSFHLPVVNIGIRQEGRERSTNIIDVPHDSLLIQKAITKALTDREFKCSVEKCANPYGDGKASRRIVDILKTIQIVPAMLQKKITY